MKLDEEIEAIRSLAGQHSPRNSLKYRRAYDYNTVTEFCGNRHIRRKRDRGEITSQYLIELFHSGTTTHLDEGEY